MTEGTTLYHSSGIICCCIKQRLWTVFGTLFRNLIEKCNVETLLLHPSHSSCICKSKGWHLFMLSIWNKWSQQFSLSSPWPLLLLYLTQIFLTVYLIGKCTYGRNLAFSNSEIWCTHSLINCFPLRKFRTNVRSLNNFFIPIFSSNIISLTNHRP